jgi:hypothetical protein
MLISVAINGLCSSAFGTHRTRMPKAYVNLGLPLWVTWGLRGLKCCLFVASALTNVADSCTAVLIGPAGSSVSGIVAPMKTRGCVCFGTSPEADTQVEKAK